jgi:hypothetical protein
MKKLISTLLLNLVGVSAQEQVQIPTPIDLRASYCIALFQQSSPVLEAFVRENPTAKASMSPLLETSKNNLSRLQNYLVPRLPFLELNAISSARDQYASDKKIIDACSARACGSNFEFKSPNECHNFCNKETGGIRDKQFACSDLTWIPF